MILESSAESGGQLTWVEGAQSYGHGGQCGGEVGEDQAGKQTSLVGHLVLV